MRKKLMIILVSVGCMLSDATGQSFKETALRNKLFPLIESLSHDPVMNKAIAGDRILQKAAENYRNRVQQAAQSCDDVQCYAAAWQLTPQEIQVAGDRLITLFRSRKGSAVWLKELRASGSYARYDSLPDTSFIRASWSELATGTNRIFSVYVAGEKPRYETIDSISFDKNDPLFLHLVKEAIDHVDEKSRNGDVLFSFPVAAAVAVLELNRRDEAVRYGPHESLYASAIAKIKTTKWDSYPYTVLLVPGYGPEAPGIPLDSRAARRCQLAAERYKKGMAPFIIVSGGHAYPIHTQFCEAIEMKKYLVRQFGIPEDDIIIEPYARHTTTNLRNASRLIYQLGIPDKRPALVVTDRSQTNMILKLDARCIRELGYVPYRGVQNLNELETVFYPVKTATHRNLDDPLDP